MSIERAPDLIIRSWTKSDPDYDPTQREIPCAFCGKAHAKFERRRSYDHNGRMILLLIRMCHWCKWVKTYVDPSGFAEQEAAIVLDLMKRNGLLSPNVRRGGH